MTMSDSDLEGRLRDLRGQVDLVPPPPHDLAERTRQGFRAQRRRRAALAVTGLVAALVLVGVPVGTSVLLGQRGSGETVGDPPPPLPAGGLYDMPARGSLADDLAWVAGVRALAWPTAAGGVPSTEDRRVVFAGEVPGGRVALVLGRLERGAARLWLVGPEDASPEEMRPALAPVEMPALASADELDGQRVALWDAPDPAADTGVLVVIAFPGETAEFVPGVERPLDGVVVETPQPFELADGVGIRTVPRPAGWPFATSVGVLRGDYSDEVRPDFSERSAAALGAPTIDDPRGLRGAVPQAWLDETAGWLVEGFGTPGVSLPLTLLYAGGIRDTATRSAVLVGATLPSGATVVGLSTFTGYWSPGRTNAEKGAGGWGAITVGTTPRPAGPPLLDQVLALRLDDTVTVAGPAAGVTAELLGADGRTVTRFTLIGGAGASVVPQAAGVRILDVTGAVVAEAALTDVG
jgi:hypothetical protein